MLRGAPASSPARQRRAQTATFPAPVAGWISNRNLAQPNARDIPQGAEILENFFPTASGVILRRGSQGVAQLGEGDTPVTALFKYSVGNNRRMFGATATTVYDITTVDQAFNYTLAAGDDTLSAGGADTIGLNSTEGKNVWPSTGGAWSTVQFSTTGGTYLIGVNGSSEGFRFDGASFVGLDTGTPAITFPAGSGLSSDDLSYVWAHKNRLWFVQKQSLDVWYLPVDQIGGALTRYPLGAELGLGGSILLGQTWSLEGGNQGGLSDQCIFLSTEGEVVVFQGDNPAQADQWRRVGVYRIGRPLGQDCILRAGGDILIATTIGFIPLSKAIQVDLTAVAPQAVSAPIEVAWNEAVQQRGEGWSCILWPEGQMVAVAPPTTASTLPTLFVANALTGAWARFTNWNATCFVTFRGRLYFGSVNGLVKEAMTGGSDDGVPFTGSVMPLFSDVGTPNSRKTAKLARLTARSGVALNERISCRFDFDKSLPPPPDVFAVPVGNEWNNATWDQSVWSVDREAVVTQRRYSIGGTGYRIAPTLQITSGSVVPLDAEIIALDVTFDVGDIFT